VGNKYPRLIMQVGLLFSPLRTAKGSRVFLRTFSHNKT